MKKCITVHNHLLNVIISELPAEKHIRILDAGCGTLNFSKFLLQNLNDRNGLKIELYGYEISEFYSIERISAVIEADPVLKNSNIKGNIRIIDIDRYQLPFEDDFFDIIISNQVVEHVSNLEEFYLEQKRIIKNGGVQIHCFPAKEVLIEPHLKVPIIHKVAHKKYAYKLLCYMYRLKGVLDKNFIQERLKYIHTDTNYKSEKWHIKMLKSMSVDVKPRYIFISP